MTIKVTKTNKPAINELERETYDFYFDGNTLYLNGYRIEKAKPKSKNGAQLDGFLA